jgi:hypothetical protein
MNHTSTVSSIAKQINESSLLAKYNLPFILGETNSLYNEGAPGLSNAFGAVSTPSCPPFLCDIVFPCIINLTSLLVFVAHFPMAYYYLSSISS